LDLLFKWIVTLFWGSFEEKFFAAFGVAFELRSSGSQTFESPTCYHLQLSFYLLNFINIF